MRCFARNLRVCRAKILEFICDAGVDTNSFCPVRLLQTARFMGIPPFRETA